MPAILVFDTSRTANADYEEVPANEALTGEKLSLGHVGSPKGTTYVNGLLATNCNGPNGAPPM